MAQENNFHGVDEVQIGPTGPNGAMGSDLTSFTEVELNSLVLEGAQNTQENIETEQNSSYLTVDGTPTPGTLTVRLYGISAEQRVMLMGGRVGSVDDGDMEGHYMAPAKKPNIHLSVRIVGQEINGKRAILNVPYGKISARDQGNITRNGLPAIEIVVTMNAYDEDAYTYSLGFEDVV